LIHNILDYIIFKSIPLQIQVFYIKIENLTLCQIQLINKSSTHHQNPMARLIARFLHVEANVNSSLRPKKSFSKKTTFGRKISRHNFPTHPHYVREKILKFPGATESYTEEESDHYDRMALRQAGYSEETVEEIIRALHGFPFESYNEKTNCAPFAARVPLMSKVEEEEIDRLTEISVDHARRNG